MRQWDVLPHKRRKLTPKLLTLVLLSAGCAPVLEIGCKKSSDCTAGSTCVAGVCIGSLDSGPRGDGDRPPPEDARIGGDLTSLPSDAHGAGPDLGPGDAAVVTVDAAVVTVDARPPTKDSGPVGDANVERDGPRPDAARPPFDAAVPPRDARLPGPDDAARPQDARLPGPDALFTPDAVIPNEPDVSSHCVPTDEVCNGLDDDCDGFIDRSPFGGGFLSEGCYTGPPATEDVGLCRAGIRQCVGGAFGDCLGETRPEVETCDGQDNDCNDLIDDVESVGDVCVAGLGRCVRMGRLVCDVDVGQVVCDAVQGAPAHELCNGADDNCDGNIDEGFSLGSDCPVGVGQCAAVGQRVCGGDGQAICQGQAGAPQQERCDHLDNDCDGQVDEDLGVGSACEVGIGACRASGHMVCGELGAVVCDAPIVPPAARELCNGIDDTCDGHVDEGFALGTACTAGVGACLQRGVFVCDSDGALTCSVQPGPPLPERCNGIDDDCDGAVDDGLGLGLACSAGVGACNAPGVMVCDRAGNTVCNAFPRAPTPETCNRLDDNCNGTVDDLPAAQVQVGVSYNTLAAYDGNCNGVLERGASHCTAAATAYCRGLGCFSDAPPPFDGDGTTTSSVACIARGTADMTVSLQDLAAYNPSCNAEGTLAALVCHSAIHRRCVALGYVSGFGPTRFDGGGFYDIACVGAPLTLNYQAVPWATLTTLNANCGIAAGLLQTGWPCNSAVNAQCVSQGYTGGFGPVEADANNAWIICYRS